jgi:hypothetical protein
VGLELQNVTWSGPPADDLTLLPLLPDTLRWLLEQEVSGFIQFHGGLHVRGACSTPDWHSLRKAWKGKKALHRVFSGITAEDIPFAQDYLGNQFFLRGNEVIKIMGETGEQVAPLDGLAVIDSDVSVDPLTLQFEVFLQAVQFRPESLGLDLLDRFIAAGNTITPGELMHIYPPLSSKEAAGGARLSATTMPVGERLAFLTRAVRLNAEVMPGERASFPLIR